MAEASVWNLLAAGIVSLAIGFVWYHPRVFGGIWVHLVNVSPEMVESAHKKMPYMSVIAVLASMLIAYVMNYFGMAWGVSDIGGAARFGFWCWAGFVAPTMLSMVLWEHKPFTLYLINALYWLVSFITIAIILMY